MQKEGNGKKYALIAAIGYIIYTLYLILNRIIAVSRSEYASITVLNVISWIILIGLVVTLFMKNKKVVVFAAGAEALLMAYYLVSYFSLWNLCDFLAYATLVAIFILAFKGNKITKSIWFISAAIMFVGCVIGWISYGHFSYISDAWTSMLFSLIEIAAVFFVGRWAGEEIAIADVAPVNEYATFNPQAVGGTSSPSTFGGADKLKMYKELLDAGTITQEEFDVKKRQILGL